MKFIPPFKTDEEAKFRYGPIIDGVWNQESKWMTVYNTPDWFQFQVINSATGKPCIKIYMNKDMVDPLNEALRLVKERGLQSELRTWDGCWMVRDIRGIPGKLSTHSYGMALDFNAKWNALGQPPQFSSEFVQCFKDAGFVWGGDFRRLDGMHFQFWP